MAVSQQQPCSSKCGQCHINGRRRRLNADLFEMHLLSRACKGMTVRHMLESMQETKDRKVWESLRYSQKRHLCRRFVLTQIGKRHANRYHFLTVLDLLLLLLLLMLSVPAGFFLNRVFSNFSHCFLCIVYSRIAACASCICQQTCTYMYINSSINQSINNRLIHKMTQRI